MAKSEEIKKFENWFLRMNKDIIESVKIKRTDDFNDYINSLNNVMIKNLEIDLYNTISFLKSQIELYNNDVVQDVIIDYNNDDFNVIIVGLQSQVRM